MSGGPSGHGGWYAKAANWGPMKAHNVHSWGLVAKDRADWGRRGMVSTQLWGLSVRQCKGRRTRPSGSTRHSAFPNPTLEGPRPGRRYRGRGSM